MGEKNSKETTDKGLISKICKQLMKLNTRETTQSKSGQKTYTDISPKKTYRWLANKHMKRCSTSLIIREMQNQNGYHFMPVRMAVIQKSTSNKCWRGCEEKGTLLHCWWECKLVQPLWRTVWRFLKKLEI